MHEEPLLLIPEEMRHEIFDELNRGAKGDFRVNVHGRAVSALAVGFSNRCWSAITATDQSA